MERGHSHDFIMNLDFLSFRALAHSSERMAAAEKIESAWLRMASAQSTVKGMKELLKPYHKTLGTSALESEQSFLDKYGGGI